MKTFHGFGPYKEMLESGELGPGRSIKIRSTKYTVLDTIEQNGRRIYRLFGPFGTYNAEGFLRNKTWQPLERFTEL